MAGLFLVTVLIGFIPDSLMKIGMIRAGQRPPFPPILHVHAVLMGAWLILMLAQTSLMATGRRALHMKLGIAAMVLAPAIVIVGILLVPTIYRAAYFGVHALPPAVQATMTHALDFAANIQLIQIRVGVLFPLFVALGLCARRHDVGLHKRLMILATALPLPAAIQRIAWLPSTIPWNPVSLEIDSLLSISPMFLWDLYRLRRIHRAYIWWFAGSLPFAIAAQLLWGTPWWLATVPRLMGVE
jgi:hypothetical protein